MRRRRLVALGFLASALALAALGQFYFVRRQDYPFDGLIFCALGAACFLIAWRSAALPRVKPVSGPRPRSLIRWVRGNPVPAGLLALALLFALVAALLSRQRAWNQSTYDVVTLWLLGIGAVVAGAFWPDRSGQTCVFPWARRLRWPSRSLELVTVAGLAVLALLLRVPALGSVPYTLSGDEAWFGLTAREVLAGTLRNPFVTAHLSMPTLFYWPITWSMRLVGDNMAGLRLPSALAGAATVPVLYGFVRHFWGRRMAFISAAFLAAYDYHIHFSRLGLNNIWDPLFGLAGLWLLDEGLRSSGGARSRRFFLLAGLAMGLGLYFYTGARLVPVLALLYAGFVWLRGHWKHSSAVPARRILTGLGLTALALLVVAGPILSFALAHPDDWNARINQVGIVQSGWLAREPALTGKSTVQILAEQFLHAAGAFHVFPDRSDWFRTGRPLLGFAAAVFALLGMAWAALRWKERRSFLILTWFWAVIITGGMLTESPPSSQRLVMAVPPVAVLVAWGLDRTVSLAGRVVRLPRRWTHLAAGLLVVALVAAGVRYYFADYSPSRTYGSENGETATMIGHYLEQYGPETRAYLFGPPRIYWGFGSITFIAPAVQGQDVVEPLQAPPDFVDKTRPAVFLFLPERIDELAWVKQSFPGGALREVLDSRGTLRFTAYSVGPAPSSSGASP